MVWIATLGLTIVFIARNYHSFIYKLSLRIDLWSNALQKIWEKPVGWGISNYSFDAKLGHWENSFNEYLSIALYIGLLGLIPLGLYLINSFKNIGYGYKRYIATSVLILCVICLGQSPMHAPRIAGTAIVLLAFLQIQKGEVVL